jgi:nitroreductase
MTIQHPSQTTLPGAVAHAATPESLTAALKWRYAVKKFDAARAIPNPLWNALEEALLLTPSSYGLQPWKFFVVDDPETRSRLRAASWGQSQVTDAARFVVFAVRSDFTAADVERHVARTAEIRNIPVTSLDGFRKMMLGLLSRAPAERQAWAAKQVYIALGNFMTSAAALGVDVCPMEGLDPAKYDEILGLKEKGYATLVAAAAGYRSEEDVYARQPKVRFKESEVLEHI